MSPDPYNLERFVTAQSGYIEEALAEIRGGAKQGHWMWFIFPQIAGLGSSPVAQRYAIHTIEEAEAYLSHPLLGRRLHECVEALKGISRLDPETVFGTIDAMKLRSSLTLFIEAGGGAAFTDVLDQWFDGQKDQATLRLLARNA